MPRIRPVIGLSMEKDFCQTNQHLFRRKLCQHQGQEGQNGGGGEERNILKCEGNESHPAHDRVAIGKIRQPLDIIREVPIDVQGATWGPFLLKPEHVLAAQ